MQTNGTRVARPVRGFTLIEMMITVAIIAILAAIAYPSYQEQVLRGRRAEGRTALMTAAQRLERYNTQFNTYDSSGANSPGVDGTTSGDNPASASYDITLAAGATGSLATSYLITATPRRADTKCGILTLDSVGTRNSAGSSPVSYCWR